MDAQTKYRLKRFFTLRSVSSKIALAFLIAGSCLLAAISSIASSTIDELITEMMASKEATDIQYLEDYLSDGYWHVKNNALYKGGLRIGDGSTRGASTKKFEQLEDKTGTYYYTFIARYLVSDEILEEVDARSSPVTDFVRAAGSTRDADGNLIVGTYMDKKVSDHLATHHTYQGFADVEGRNIYCLYKKLIGPDGNVIGVVAVGHSVEELKSTGVRVYVRIFDAVFVLLILATAGILIIIYRWLRSMNKAKGYLERIGTGVFPEEPLEFGTRDEMDDMAVCINEMTASLREKERIGAELSLATDIQAHMLPTVFPPFPDHDEFSIFATMHPAKEVGGDFYDFFMLDDHRLAVVVADVSGKGVPAALFMVITKTLIKNQAQAGLTPAEVFTKVNHMLAEENETSLFVTAWMGVLDLESGELTYVNAGHNPPCIREGDGAFRYLRSRPGFVLAGMDGVRYRENHLTLSPGDRLFLYTDGVTEATRGKTELYGEERLLEFLNTHPTDVVEEVLPALRRNIDEFTDGAEQFDDITMLLLNYKRAKGGNGMTVKEFPATDASLQDVLAFVEEELDKAECPMKLVMQISVAVEETFVNIAHYAYSGAPGLMQLGILADPEGVTLRFTDRGMPFDPLKRADPDITLSAEERKIGGLGIFMVKKTMDEVTYAYENGQNVFTMHKNFR